MVGCLRKDQNIPKPTILTLAARVVEAAEPEEALTT
jgi:hypothetical protein